MDAIRISTGGKRIPIVRDGVPVGEIAFNPEDVVFAEKFYRFYGELGSKQAELERRARELTAENGTDEAGVPLNVGRRIEYLQDVNRMFRGYVDDLFGPGTSQMVFGDYLSYDMVIYRQFFKSIAPQVKTTRAKKIEQYASPASAKRNRRTK